MLFANCKQRPEESGMQQNDLEVTYSKLRIIKLQKAWIFIISLWSIQMLTEHCSAASFPPDCDLKVLPSRPTMLSALLHLILQHLSLKIFKSKSAKWKSAQQFKTNFSCLIIFRHTEEGWLHKVSSIEKMPLNCQSCVFQRDFHYTVKACPLVSR